MTKKTCNMCIYYDGNECKRYPPNVGFDGEDLVFSYAMVRKDDWCGEWSPKPDKEKLFAEGEYQFMSYCTSCGSEYKSRCITDESMIKDTDLIPVVCVNCRHTDLVDLRYDLYYRWKFEEMERQQLPPHLLKRKIKR